VARSVPEDELSDSEIEDQIAQPIQPPQNDAQAQVEQDTCPIDIILDKCVYDMSGESNIDLPEWLLYEKD
jgi:hypothetical protein